MAHSTLQEILKSILFAAAVLSFGATYGQAANVHQHNGPSRRGLHQVQSQLKSNNDTGAELTKRLDNKGRATWYNVGMGACGKHNVDSDFIVALNSPQYGSGYPGPNCFKEITLSYNGKTAQAMIMDECPPCPSGGLDLSPDLFKYLANDLDVGVIQLDWSFSGGGGNNGKSSDKEKQQEKEKEREEREKREREERERKEREENERKESERKEKEEGERKEREERERKERERKENEKKEMEKEKERTSTTTSHSSISTTHSSVESGTSSVTTGTNTKNGSTLSSSASSSSTLTRAPRPNNTGVPSDGLGGNFQLLYQVLENYAELINAGAEAHDSL